MDEPRRDTELMDANRALWDSWTPHHVAGEFYDVEGFKAGRDTIDEIEAGGVGDVAGKTLLHLQCHFGMDTLSWARRGAKVTGVDFSEEAVAVARELAEELGLDGRFVVSNVYDALEALDGERFDVVFTSYGAISWLPDLDAWAEVVAGALKPGGVFEIVEHHPYLWPFDENVEEPALVWKYDYFDSEAIRDDMDGSYGAPESGVKAPAYSWQHGFEDQIGALARAGLRVTSLTEYPFISFPWFKFNVQGDDGFWHMPEGMPGIPMMYRITATRDA